MFCRNLVVLGSTGSIGTQTLQAAEKLNIKIAAITANTDSQLLEAQTRRFRPQLAVCADEGAARGLKTALADTSVRVLGGAEAVCEAAALNGADTVLDAVVGIAGLSPALAAIHAGKRLALANKETMVAAGALVTAEAKRCNVEILPVDSEHSAIFQCLREQGAQKHLAEILLTASGGPFFGKSAEFLRTVTPQMALKHPNWSMGAKVTIDSATLLNKGLEIIEAMWLFGVPESMITVVVQPQSIVHSMVRFCDNSVIAQMGTPDMRLPIQYALTYPDRLPSCAEKLDFNGLNLSFSPPDETVFTSLAAAEKAAKSGGLATCALNAADEAAVRLFLNGRISFPQIGEILNETLLQFNNKVEYTLSDVQQTDAAVKSEIYHRYSNGDLQ